MYAILDWSEDAFGVAVALEAGAGQRALVSFQCVRVHVAAAPIGHGLARSCRLGTRGPKRDPGHALLRPLPCAPRCDNFEVTKGGIGLAQQLLDGRRVRSISVFPVGVCV